MEALIAWLTATLLASGVPSVAEMEQAFVRARVASGITGPAVFRVDERIPYYVGAMLSDGTCHVAFNPRQHVTGQVLIGKLRGEAREAMLVAGLVHEIAHCQESLLAGESYNAAQLAPPGLAERARNVHDWRALQAESPEASRWSELLADFALLAYLAAEHPAAADEVVRHLVWVRELGGRFGHAGHNTSEHLARAYAKLQQRQSETTPFLAALRLRQELGERALP